MFKGFRVGSLFGIPIRLDVTLLLVLPVLAYLIGSQMPEVVELLNESMAAGISDPLTGGLTPWVLGFAAAVGLFACVLLHELGHSLVAIRYGYGVASITLWLLGGVAQPEEQPRNWLHEFWIAIAGPIVSIALAAVCYGAFLLVSTDGLVFLFGYLAILNIVLAAFNMLPAFPLDGGRVLRALLGRSRPHAQATQRAVAVGKAFAVVFAIVGIVLFNVFLIAIAFFVYIAAAAEGRQTVLQAVFEDVTVGDVMTPAADVQTVTPETSLEALLDRMFRERHTGYPVVEAGELIGVITLTDVRETDPDDRPEMTVADAMSTDLKTVTPETDAMDAFRTLARDDIGRLLVTDADGRLAGLVTRSDLVTAMNVIREHRLVAGERSTPAR